MRDQKTRGEVKTVRWQQEAMRVNVMARKHRKDGDVGGISAWKRW